MIFMVQLLQVSDLFRCGLMEGSRCPLSRIRCVGGESMSYRTQNSFVRTSRGRSWRSTNVLSEDYWNNFRGQNDQQVNSPWSLLSMVAPSSCRLVPQHRHLSPHTLYALTALLLCVYFAWFLANAVRLVAMASCESDLAVVGMQRGEEDITPVRMDSRDADNGNRTVAMVEPDQDQETQLVLRALAILVCLCVSRKVACLFA